jgi:predicted molibdopterin-dependent oxidoreductase YjgC
MSSENNITNRDLLEVTSRQGEFEVLARVSDSVLTGSVFLPFDYAKGAADILINSALDPVAKIPGFKVCAVKLSKLN